MTFESVKALVAPDQQAVDRVIRNRLASDVVLVNQVAEYIVGSGGKRLRPVLVLLSARACGYDGPHRYILAAVVEMIHTATLVHDDVLDEATTRRHVATINSRWTNETSVLLGDFLFTHAFHLASSFGDATACRMIGRATNIVCEGEMAQVADRGNLSLTEEQYLDIIEAKTAELCAISCYLGGHYGGASPTVCEALDGFGRSLGIAFQIADDLLDVMQDSATLGKTAGKDAQQHKITFPAVYGLAESKRMAEDERQKAHDALVLFGASAQRLGEQTQRWSLGTPFGRTRLIRRTYGFARRSQSQR
jgi:octaprenyl-diphosphate synthase